MFAQERQRYSRQTGRISSVVNPPAELSRIWIGKLSPDGGPGDALSRAGRGCFNLRDNRAYLLTWHVVPAADAEWNSDAPSKRCARSMFAFMTERSSRWARRKAASTFKSAAPRAHGTKQNILWFAPHKKANNCGTQPIAPHY
jgi:hypothetical protein